MGRQNKEENWFIFTIGLLTSVTRKKSPKVYKSCPKMISLEKLENLTPLQICLKMWEIWANYLLPRAIKSCPKSNKSPNLVTLLLTQSDDWKKTFLKTAFDRTTTTTTVRTV